MEKDAWNQQFKLLRIKLGYSNKKAKQTFIVNYFLFFVIFFFLDLNEYILVIKNYLFQFKINREYILYSTFSSPFVSLAKSWSLAISLNKILYRKY